MASFNFGWTKLESRVLYSMSRGSAIGHCRALGMGECESSHAGVCLVLCIACAITLARISHRAPRFRSIDRVIDCDSLRFVSEENRVVVHWLLRLRYGRSWNQDYYPRIKSSHGSGAYLLKGSNTLQYLWAKLQSGFTRIADLRTHCALE